MRPILSYCQLLKLILNLFSDAVPRVLIKSWPLNADMFDGDVMAGPVPTLFAVDEDEAIDAMMENPEKVKLWRLEIRFVSRTL